MQLQEVQDEISHRMVKTYCEAILTSIKPSLAFGFDKTYPEKAMNIEIGPEDIQQKDEMKLLGVSIDSELNFINISPTHVGRLAESTNRYTITSEKFSTCSS